MLEPQTRAALTEQLAPPPGYELVRAVGTTFTLDLATALTVPLCFASHRVSAADDQLGSARLQHGLCEHIGDREERVTACRTICPDEAEVLTF